MATIELLPTHVNGEVLEKFTGLPLADVRVRWELRAADGHESARANLGEARTDREGNFTISLFPIEAGIAMSNAGKLLGTNQPLKLNALVGLTLNQPFRLEIDKRGVEAELQALFDVGLFFEYSARL